MKPLHFLSLLVVVALQWACKTTIKSTSESLLFKNLSAKRVQLSNGWSLTPAGISPLNLDDLPLTMVLSPSKKKMAITNNGQSTQSIMLIDTKTKQLLDKVTPAKLFVGLAFSPDEKYIYASGGHDNKILVYEIANNKLIAQTSIELGKAWPHKIDPVGLCVHPTKPLLYVVTKDDSTLYVCNTATKKIEKSLKLSAEGYTCMLSPNGEALYISMWGGAKISVVNTETLQIEANIPTPQNPNDMVLAGNGQFLFVSHGDDNVVSLIDLKAKKVIETLTTSLYPDAPVGSTPDGVALSEDEKTLYVANADNNCLAVFDVSEKGKSRSLGFIPTGWYPTAVKVIDNSIWVTNGKGFSSMPNPNGPNPVSSKAAQQKGPNPEANNRPGYIGGLFKGTLSLIDRPDEATLAAYSRLVYANTPYNKAKEQMADGEEGNPIPMKVQDKSPIKYVFYIIKENRTYDQILGDLKGGNGDASLCLFPQKVTPNQHALATEFVLLDNFYVDAEVSADGHNWSTAAYSNDYVEKNWVSSYGGRGGSYDFEGQRPVAYPRDGFIWDHAQRANVTYRTYGEFADGSKTNLTSLKGNFCTKYFPYNLAIKDIVREKVWEADFDSLLTIRKVPQLNTIRLGNDHTSGARLGMATPEAAVADNDLAVGRLVEHLSKSSIWNESVVFVLEDDAQNGPDHVDAHRSTAYVAGGFVKRGFIDHTMYSTSGLLRTIELILGMKPMSQYDAAATPMWRCFDKTANKTPFIAKQAQVNIEEKNITTNFNSKRSRYLDLTKPDAIDDLLFGEIVWQTVKGQKSRMPAPTRGAFVRLNKREQNDEDDDD